MRGADLENPPLQVQQRGRLCSVAGCGKPHEARGFCNGHYQELRITERPECSVEGCTEGQHARGFCRLHHHRVLKTGSPGTEGRRKAWPGTGYINDDGYRMISVDGVKRAEHRVVMERLLGRELLTTESVHHRNGIRSDNRPANLELWVRPQIAGQRVADLVAFVVEQYPEYVEAALRGETQLRLVQ